jgi:hypothetical protein
VAPFSHIDSSRIRVIWFNTDISLFFREIPMLGVVLWRDEAEGKAVFWCEDQGDLAYFDGNSVPSSDDNTQVGYLNVGDVVRFDVTFENRLRRANAPSVVEQHACASLADDLRNSGLSDQPQTNEVAEVVRFQPRSEQVLSLQPKRRAL